jgi:hypothetical protein
MFKKFKQSYNLNKTIKSMRKFAESEPYTGYSAIISHLLAEEANNTFVNYPKYMKDAIHNFYEECMTKWQQCDDFKKTIGNANDLDVALRRDNIEFSAALVQAVCCKNLSPDDVKMHEPENLVKILVNMKLLPTRFLCD